MKSNQVGCWVKISLSHIECDELMIAVALISRKSPVSEMLETGRKIFILRNSTYFQKGVRKKKFRICFR